MFWIDHAILRPPFTDEDHERHYVVKSFYEIHLRDILNTLRHVPCNNYSYLDIAST